MLDDFSKSQQKIIKRYYANRDDIAYQRLSELVTELYLAEGKKREKLWEHAVAAMQKLEVPQTRIDHLRKEDRADLVANLVKELGE